MVEVSRAELRPLYEAVLAAERPKVADKATFKEDRTVVSVGALAHSVSESAMQSEVKSILGELVGR